MANDELCTPPGLFEELDREFCFEFDAACTNGNALADPLPAPLERPWPVARIWCNPPYSAPSPWVERALEATKRGATVVLLLQSDTSTAAFAGLLASGCELRFIQGRLVFGGCSGRARFASVVAIAGPGISGEVKSWAPTKAQRGFKGPGDYS